MPHNITAKITEVRRMIRKYALWSKCDIILDIYDNDGINQEIFMNNFLTS